MSLAKNIEKNLFYEKILCVGMVMPVQHVYLVYPSSALWHVTQFQDVDHVEVNDIKYFAVFIVGNRNPVRQ